MFTMVNMVSSNLRLFLWTVQRTHWAEDFPKLPNASDSSAAAAGEQEFLVSTSGNNYSEGDGDREGRAERNVEKR